MDHLNTELQEINPRLAYKDAFLLQRMSSFPSAVVVAEVTGVSVLTW